MLPFLDFIGTVAFALYGAERAHERDCDIVGIAVSAVLYALGGGILREVLMGGNALFFLESRSLIAIVSGIVLAIAGMNTKAKKWINIVDALGLSTFAYVGASLAEVNALGGAAVIFIATISATGGGILGDIALNEKPRVFYTDVYVVPAFLVGVAFVLLGPWAQTAIGTTLLIAGCFALRIAALKWKLKVWKP